MPRADLQLFKGVATTERLESMAAKVGHAVLAVGALAFLSAYASPASADSLSRSVDVTGTPDAVWSMIGPFCAIKDWHPAIGACTEDGQMRTLVTKDGKATFVEQQTERSDADHHYSYTITSSPLPITHYTSTLAVAAKCDGMSTITWSSTFTPDAGKEKDANDALTGIYESGLAAIKTKLSP